MAIRYTPGGGFQSVAPGTPIVTIPGISKPPQSPLPSKPSSSTGGGSGKKSGGSNKKKETKIELKEIDGRGTEVIIDGVGYSVLPGQVETFLKSKNLSGSSYSKAIIEAKQKDSQARRDSIILPTMPGIKMLSDRFPNIGPKTPEGTLSLKNVPSPTELMLYKYSRDIAKDKTQREQERLYEQIFNREGDKVKVVDYDKDGKPISFKYGDSIYSGKYAVENLNNRLNTIAQVNFIKEEEKRTIEKKGIDQYSKDVAFKLGTEALENVRQGTFNIIDVLVNTKVPTKGELDKVARDMGFNVAEVKKFEGKVIKDEKDKIMERLFEDSKNIKDKTKSEFVKGAVDDVFDLLNLASVGVYALSSDKQTRKEVGSMVGLSLLNAPKTYWNYLKKDPVGGIAFSVGSVVGIAGIVDKLIEGGKSLSKSNVANNINKAITEVEGVRKMNLNILEKAGMNINKLSKDYGIEFTKVINGLDDGSSIGLKDIKIKTLPKKYVDAWNLFEGVGESTGKISPRILKQFSESELKKIDIKIKALAETELTGKVLEKTGKAIQDLAEGKLTFDKRKGITLEANQIPTGRITGTKTGKNYLDKFTINKDKSFSGIAKRIMKNGDVVEQQYYTKGVNAIVREFYVNGKLKYSVTQARTGGRVIIKSGSDIVFEGIQSKIAKNMDLVEETFKEVRKKATIFDIKQNFKGRVTSVSKDFNYIKASPLKTTLGMELFIKDGAKSARFDIITPAKIVKKQSDVFADFIKKRNANLMADGYLNEVVNLKSMVIPEYVAIRRTLNSSKLQGIFSRNPTLLEKTRAFISRLNRQTTDFFSRPMNKRGSLILDTTLDKLNKLDYDQKLKYANEVKVNYSKPLQVNLEKTVTDMSKVLNTFQYGNVSLGFRKLWASRLIRLKLQSQYLNYLNKQHILTLREYKNLTKFKESTDTKSRTAQRQRMDTQTKMDNQVKLSQTLETQPKMNIPKMQGLKLNFEMMKFPKLTEDNRQKLVNKILGSKRAKSYVVVLGSGKKRRVVSKRLKPTEAISYGAYLTDRKGDRTVRIVPAKGKPNQRFKIDYLAQTSKKFRNYRIKKGKKVKYSSARLIEKRKYFNDLERLSSKSKKTKLTKSKRR